MKYSLPLYKKYLFNLQDRIRLFRKVNKYKSLKLKPGDIWVIHHFLKRAGKGGILRKPRAFIIDCFVRSVEEFPARCTNREFKLAVKLSWIKSINVGEIYMEMKELRNFAKEVGLEFSLKEIKSMDEVDLIREIVQKVSNDGDYSNEFVEWYSGLDEDGPYFKEKESKKSKKKEKEEPEVEEVEVDVEELKTAVEDADDIEELQELIKELPSVFPKKLMKMDDVEDLQEAMMNILEGTEIEKEVMEDNGDDDNDDEVDVNSIIEAVKEAEDIETLKDIYKDEDANPYFEDVSIRGKVKFETLKENMLKALGVESEETQDSDSMLEELEELSVFKLRKRAKEMGIEVKMSDSKNKLIEMILNEVNEGKAIEPEDEGVEVDASFIKKLVNEKDLESLLEIAKEMELKVPVLNKRSPLKVGNQIIEALEEKEEVVEEKPEKKKPLLDKKKKKDVEDETKGSMYAAIKELVDRGKDEDFIIKKVKQLIKVVSGE